MYPDETNDQSDETFDQDRYDQPLWWLRRNGHDLAGVTGSERRALLAIAWLWELYSVSSSPQDVLASVRAVLPCVQSKHHPLVRELIARAMDWSDRDRLWPKVAPGRKIDVHG